MSIYVISDRNDPDLAEVTGRDLAIQGIKEDIIVADISGSPLAQVEQLAHLPLKDGDTVCFAGLVLRPSTWDYKSVAVESKKNLMPGRIVDHRSVNIPLGSFFARKPQEENGYVGVPYVMVLGDAAGAQES